jgi:hypothetical protein
MLPIFARIALAFSRQPGMFIQLLTKESKYSFFFRRWQRQVNDDSEDTVQR